MCFSRGMRMCMWIGHNCWINFCLFFDIVNLVIFHPDYIDSGYLLWAQLLLQFCTNCFQTSFLLLWVLDEILNLIESVSEGFPSYFCMCFSHGMRRCMWIGHSCWINFRHFFGIVNLVIFHPEYISNEHPQPSTWAGWLILSLDRHLVSYFISKIDSDKTVLICRIVWAFTCCLCNNYHNHITWIIV